MCKLMSVFNLHQACSDPLRVIKITQLHRATGHLGDKGDSVSLRVSFQVTQNHLVS